MHRWISPHFFSHSRVERPRSFAKFEFLLERSMALQTGSDTAFDLRPRWCSPELLCSENGERCTI